MKKKLLKFLIALPKRSGCRKIDGSLRAIHPADTAMPALFRICYLRLASRGIIAGKNVHWTIVVTGLATDTFFMINSDRHSLLPPSYNTSASATGSPFSSNRTLSLGMFLNSSLSFGAALISATGLPSTFLI